MVLTTSWGRSPRTSASRPGTIRGDSTSLDAGARGCPLSEKGDPSSEEFAKEGLSRGASVLGTKSDWASKVPPKGLVPRTPWPCTGSVREGSLEETHICIGTSPGDKQVYLCAPEASPNQLEYLGVESPFSRKGGLQCSPTLSAARESIAVSSGSDSGNATLPDRGSAAESPSPEPSSSPDAAIDILSFAGAPNKMLCPALSEDPVSSSRNTRWCDALEEWEAHGDALDREALTVILKSP